MQDPGSDPTALSFTIISLRVALEESLKALAEKNGNQAGASLDDVQDLALLRARAHLADTQERDAATAAIAVVEVIFERLRSGFSSGS
jgi:phage terminase Nu1 subunit (DNA packaging protein)